MVLKILSRTLALVTLTFLLSACADIPYSAALEESRIASAAEFNGRPPIYHDSYFIYGPQASLPSNGLRSPHYSKVNLSSPYSPFSPWSPFYPHSRDP